MGTLPCFAELSKCSGACPHKDVHSAKKLQAQIQIQVSQQVCELSVLFLARNEGIKGHDINTNNFIGWGLLGLQSGQAHTRQLS